MLAGAPGRERTGEEGSETGGLVGGNGLAPEQGEGSSGPSSGSRKGKAAQVPARGHVGDKLQHQLVLRDLGRGPWAQALTRARSTASPPAPLGCPFFHRCEQRQGSLRHMLTSTRQAQALRHTHLRVRGSWGWGGVGTETRCPTALERTQL